MSSPRRRSLRLRTVDPERVDDSKTESVPVIDITQQSRDLTPKSEPSEAPAELLIAKSPVRLSKPTTSNRYGCPRRTDDGGLSDTQIAKNLDWCMRRSTMGKRVGDASRTVLQLTGQWPWEFAANFLPKKWGIIMLEDIRRLLRSVCKSARTAGPGPHTRIVRDFLLGCAKKRDTHCPHLTHADVLDAIDHFSADFYTKRDFATPIKFLPGKGQVEQITVLESDEESQVDEGQDYESEDGRDNAIEIPDSESEWEDWTGYNFDDDEPAVQNEAVSVVVKRSRSPSMPVLPEKRPRVASPVNVSSGGNGTTAQETEPPSQTHTIPSQRPKTFTDIVNDFEVLEIEKRKELDAVTHSLHEVTTSIEASESGEIKLGSEKVEKLCTDVKSYETEREKILKGKRFVEEHHEDMAMNAEDLAKAIHKYTIRLEECDRLIAQANSDVFEELEAIAQKDFDLRAEEKRLKTRGQEVLQEVEYSHAVKTLMRLGPSGMATLLAKLETKDIALIGMAEGIMIERAVASLDDIFDNDGTGGQT